MELAQQHRNLIENIVRKNPRYGGNEDLLEDFCSETFKRSYNIVSTVNNIENLEIYLNKIASSAILEVLKTSGRLRRTKEGYEQIKNASVSCHQSYKVDEAGNMIFDIVDPSDFIEEKVMKKDEVELIRQKIQEIDELNKEKKYLELFVLRFVKNNKQSQIATSLGLSQGEVSKRLVELAKMVNESLK